MLESAEHSVSAETFYFLYGFLVAVLLGMTILVDIDLFLKLETRNLKLLDSLHSIHAFYHTPLSLPVIL